MVSARERRWRPSGIGGPGNASEHRELTIKGLFGNAVDLDRGKWSWVISRHGKWTESSVRLAHGSAKNLADAKSKVDRWERAQEGQIRG